MLQLWAIDRGRPANPRTFEQALIRLGRSSSNDVVLKASHVSARHGEISTTPGGDVIYRDLGTRNGTYLRRGGETLPVARLPSRRVELLDGDELFLGEPDMYTSVRVRITGPDSEVVASEVLDTGMIQVLTKLDVTDPTRIQELPASFDREALLALHEYGARTARLRDLQDILREFSDAVLGLFRKASHVSIYLADAADGQFAPARTRTRRGDVQPTRLSRTLRDVVREHRHAVTFTMEDPRFNSAESLRAASVRAGICVPLWTGERMAGLLQIDGRSVHQEPFADHDLEVAVVFANQLATAVENATLQEHLEQTVADLRGAQSEMERLAFTDPLTGLSNRRLLRDRLEQAVKLARRLDRDAVLMFLDLDHFKRINDTFGHDVGDVLLKHVAARLRASLRAQDTVARIGGDEFAVIVFDVSGEAAAATVASKLLDALREPIRLPEQSVTVSASIGLTLAPSDGEDASKLLRNADLAMYRAKSRGRNRIHFFTEEMNQEASRRLQLETELRDALEWGQFVEHYQPIVRVADRCLVGLEALVRWQHPTRGLTMPDSFIEVAEQSGLIVPLGKWVLDRACHQARTLASRESTPLRVAVNLSVRQFLEPDLPALVERLIAKHEIAPELLELEITENLLMEDTRESLDRLNRLKSLGVSLCVDDFGTGYSSLSYLKRLPVDALKIDRSFVSGLPHDSSDVEITAAVIAMAHKLRLRVTAEGVTDEAQLEFLRENGCDDAQGYLFGEPSYIEPLERS